MENLHLKIQSAWKHLIFRRVQWVVPEGDPIFIVKKENDEIFKEITFQEYNNLSSDVKERECELKYRAYSGLTNSKPMLTQDKTCKGCCKDYNSTVTFHSSNYCELDMSDENSSFYFNPNIPVCKVVDCIPRPYRTIVKPVYLKEPTGTKQEIEDGDACIEKGKSLCREAKALLQKRDAEKIMEKLLVNKDSNVTQEAEQLLEMATKLFREGKQLLKKEWTTKTRSIDLAGDIICGVLNPRNKNRFQFWFIASEQFYRFFQLIMHVNHPGTCLAGLNKRSRVLSGNNKLCTNTYQKKMMEINILKKEIEKQKNIQGCSSSWAEIMDIDDLITKLIEKKDELEIPEYWSLRSEKISREFCHIYPALTLMCLYKEKLTSQNIPGNLSRWLVPNWML